MVWSLLGCKNPGSPAVEYLLFAVYTAVKTALATILPSAYYEETGHFGRFESSVGLVFPGVVYSVCSSRSVKVSDRGLLPTSAASLVVVAAILEVVQ